MPTVFPDRTVALLIEVLHALVLSVPQELGNIRDDLFLLTQKVNSMSGDIATQITQELESLQTDVAAQTTEVASVRVAFNGLAKQLADALAAAKAAGATEAQLASLKTFHQALLANTQGMVEAVAQGTPSEGQTGTTGGDATGAVQ